jgi:hypothetical protein
VGVIRLSSSTGGVWVSSTIRGHGVGEAIARPHESFIHTPEPAFVTAEGVFVEADPEQHALDLRRARDELNVAS